MRALIYTRVSTDEQVKKYGLDTQLRDCRGYAAANGMEIVAELADDISGAIPIVNRPQGSLIYQYAENGEVDAVLIPTLDRTARDEHALEYQLFKHYLHENEIELHYADTGLDPDTMEGTLVGFIRAYNSGQERKKITRRTTEGRRSKALNNKPVMIGYPPYGYYREGKFSEARLLIDEAEAQVVRQMFNWYAFGDGDGKPLTLRGIAMRLNDMGQPTPNHKGHPGKEWIISTVRRILGNEIYAGVTYYGKTQIVKNRGKELTVNKPQEEWIRIEVPELAIIDRATFDWVQERVEINKQNSKRNRKHDYLLAGHFRCGSCGKAMVGNHRKKKERGHEYFYRCGSQWLRASDNKCPIESKQITEWIVDGLVWEWVEVILGDEENLEMGLRRMVEQRKEQTGPRRERLEAIEDLLDNTERKIRRLIGSLENEEDEFLVAELRSSLKTASKQREGLLREKDSLIEAMGEQEIAPEKIDIIRQYAAEIRLKLRNPTFEQKRIILDMIRLECVFRVEDIGRWIDVKCDLNPDGNIIELHSP